MHTFFLPVFSSPLPRFGGGMGWGSSQVARDYLVGRRDPLMRD
jgi:hypothetical protein